MRTTAAHSDARDGIAAIVQNTATDSPRWPVTPRAPAQRAMPAKLAAVLSSAPGLRRHLRCRVESHRTAVPRQTGPNRILHGRLINGGYL